MRRLKCTDIQSNPTQSLQSIETIEKIGRCPLKQFKNESLAQKNHRGNKTLCSSLNSGYYNVTCLSVDDESNFRRYPKALLERSKTARP